MKRSRIAQLAAVVETAPTWDMGSPEVHGHPTCIAGWAAHLWAREMLGGGRSEIEEAAAEALGTPPSLTRRLFRPRGPRASYLAEPEDAGYISRAHAAATLRYLAATGRVDWAEGRRRTAP